MSTKRSKPNTSSKTHANGNSDGVPLYRRFQAAIAAGYSEAVAPAAEALYELGGKKVLPKVAKEWVQGLACETAPQALEAGATVVKTVSKVSGAVVTSSAKVVLRGAAKSSVFGAGIDLAVSSYSAIKMVRHTDMTSREAAIFVAKETGKGGIATAAGVVATAGVIALAGPLAPLAAMGVSIAATLATRTALDAIDTPRHDAQLPAGNP